MTESDEALSPWRRACLAADVFALDPLGAGVVVRGRPGPARDAWLQRLRAALPPGAPMRRVPTSIADDRLLGGLDIAATLAAGRPVAETGLIAEADGGVLVIAMAERLPAGVAARIAAAIDIETITLARDGITATLPARIGFVALDEGCDDDEAPPPILVERSACFVNLDGIGARDIRMSRSRPTTRGRARGSRRSNATPPRSRRLVGAAAELGIASLRAPLFALRVARAICSARRQVQSRVPRCRASRGARARPPRDAAPS